MDIRSRIENRDLIIFDGAMGTMLQKKGLKAGEIPELINITNRNEIIDIHRSYIESGCEVITTNTFGANEIKLAKADFSVEKIISAAIENAKEAIMDKDISIAYDMGPIGELLEPMGTLNFDYAYDIFKRQVKAAEEYGADLILIETMMDLYEAKAAVLAAKENTSLPIFCTMTFEKDGRTFTGCTPISMVNVLQGLGADAIGINCSLGPGEIIPIVRDAIKYAKVPFIVQPNAGIPRNVCGSTVFDVKPDEFAESCEKLVDLGVQIIGGCCGTDDSYIKLVSRRLKRRKAVNVEKHNFGVLCTPSRYIKMDGIKVIGERINPSGKEAFKAELLRGNVDYILKEAAAQSEAGCDILDVNIGAPDIDEAYLMEKAVCAIQSIVDVPLQIDSSSPEVIERGLRVYNGKAVINSVNGSEESMNKIFPIAKKYGAAVVGLTLDEDGLPCNAEKRVEIAENIILRAEKYGISREDIYIDCLTLTAAAQQKDVMDTLNAMKIIKDRYNVNTVLGVSNISFGLPGRNIINRTFLACALSYGLTMPIIDPLDKNMMDTVMAYKVLSMEDKGALDFINYYSDSIKEKKLSESYERKALDLKECILNGFKNDAVDLTRDLLFKTSPFDIIDNEIIPALDDAGLKFDRGEIFLPQLMQCAESVKEVFNVIKEKIGTKKKYSKGTILLATVEGDVHDIGKNIVKVFLENYGFDVVDMGRDVPIIKIVEYVEKNDVKLVGLSALMTTTVENMNKTIKALRENGSQCLVMVGGAVLTKEYAMKIGADYYAADAKESVAIARKVFKAY